MRALRAPTGLLEEIPPFRSRSLSESTLFNGYGSAGAIEESPAEPIVEPCACGEEIALWPGQVIEVVYAAHVRGMRHRAWSGVWRSA